METAQPARRADPDGRYDPRYAGRQGQTRGSSRPVRSRRPELTGQQVLDDGWRVNVPGLSDSPDFFISYTAADQEWAEWIAWQLEEAGYRVLVQAWDFIPGTNWMAGMQQGVTKSARTIALLSHAYLNSVYGQTEWQAAQAADPLGFARKLIPIRIADCPRPGLLGQIVSFDLFDLFGLSADAATARLTEQIRILHAGRAKPAATPAFPAQSAARPPLPAPEPARPAPPST
ncbi:toll/interleukin-1 receptor domain-containing protein, partial [Parafrankia sp. FMc6]|uniref:toll/interleukin-1 receptor domain-containing protein n=1 Tax=Parafrankia soli TaxID=2599596 RepID=UPI0034D55B71